MSRLVAQILFCLLMFPLAVVCYCSTVLTLNDRVSWTFRYDEQEITAGLTTWAFVAIYWTAIWFKSVKWTLRRILAPVIFAVVGLAAGAVGPVITLIHSGSEEAHILLLSILIPAAWLVVTVYFWRETPAERAARVGASGAGNISCPTCGYNLTGLTEARCPECGTKYTLEQLLASQRGGTTGDIN